MGNSDSSLDKGMQQFILGEFEKVKRNKNRNYIILAEILKLSPPVKYNRQLYFNTNSERMITI